MINLILNSFSRNMKISLIIFLHVYLHGVVEILEAECGIVEIFLSESTLRCDGNIILIQIHWRGEVVMHVQINWRGKVDVVLE